VRQHDKPQFIRLSQGKVCGILAAKE